MEKVCHRDLLRSRWKFFPKIFPQSPSTIVPHPSQETLHPLRILASRLNLRNQALGDPLGNNNHQLGGAKFEGAEPEVGDEENEGDEEEVSDENDEGEMDAIDARGGRGGGAGSEY